MTRIELMRKLWNLCADESFKFNHNLIFKVVAKHAFYVKRDGSTVLVKFEAGSLARRPDTVDAIVATVLSKKQKVEEHWFPFTLMERELVRPDGNDSTLHLWAGVRGEDWYTTKPTSYDPLVIEMVEYARMWHDLPQ